MKFDVIIIGAGIVGAACALECAEAGLKVAIVESNFVGGGTTAEGMGHIALMDESDAELKLCKYSCRLWTEKSVDMPVDCEVDNCGSIWVATNEEDVRALQRKKSNLEKQGIQSELIDDQALSELEPNLKGCVAGLRIPSDKVVYSPTCAKWMVDRSVENGAQLFQGKKVIKLKGHLVVMEDGTKLTAGHTINATGVAAPKLTPGLPIVSRKGHLLITDRYPGFLKHQIVEVGYSKSTSASDDEAVAFNIQPRKTGQILIGSSRQYGVEEREINQRIINKMLKRSIRFVPGISALRILRVWTGFRPATPDGLPLIGPHAEDDRLLIAAGHEGLGITTSMGTARILVNFILNRKQDIPVDPYLPGRIASGYVNA